VHITLTPSEPRRSTEEALMGDLNAVEIKAFVPARHFALSKGFYEARGRSPTSPICIAATAVSSFKIFTIRSTPVIS
jgi:hypothetical protein